MAVWTLPAAVVALAAFAPTPQVASATASPCAQPDVPPSTVWAEPPQAPPIAAQLGVSGTVQVVVSLDERSRVVGTAIQSSPSAVLNLAALTAARHSVFNARVADCVPRAGRYVFSVAFAPVPAHLPAREETPSGPVITAIGEGRAAGRPHVSSATVEFVTHAADASAAAADNDARFAAFHDKLIALGVAPAQYRAAYYDMLHDLVPASTLTTTRGEVTSTTATSMHGAGFVATHAAVVTISSAVPLDAVLRAAKAAGAASARLMYDADEATHKAAYDAALRAAAALAERDLAGHGVHLGAVVRTTLVSPSDTVTTTVALDDGPLAPSTFDATVRLAVTYAVIADPAPPRTNP